MDAQTDIVQRVFGSRARVLVLRVLDGVGVPLNVSQVARAAGLTKPAASTALEDLGELGLVESTRSGRSWLHWLIRDNYLVEHMVAPVFEAERRLEAEIEAALLGLFAEAAVSVLLFGSRARGQADPGSDVDVLLVAQDEAAKDVLRGIALDSAADFRARFGATLSALTYTRAEASALQDTAPGLHESLSRDGLVLHGSALDAARQHGPSPGGPSDAKTPSRRNLERLLEGIEDPIERRLAFAGMLSRACREFGWREPVVVGGHAVEFYTAGGYTTVDIDLVAASDGVGEVLESWGFIRDGRHWYDEALGLLVEAPGHQLDDEQMSHVLFVDVRGERIAVLGIEDLVVDRLNALVHWGSEESGEWARTLVGAYRDRIDWDYLRERARAEDVKEALSDMAGGP